MRPKELRKGDLVQSMDEETSVKKTGRKREGSDDKMIHETL